MHRLGLKFPDTGQQVRSVDFACLFIGLFVLVAVFYQFRLTTEAINYWNVRVEHLEKQQQPKKIVKRTRSKPRKREISQEIRLEIKEANVVLRQINLPWEALFDAIEHAASQEIALLSLEPNTNNQSLRIGGEAKNMSVLLDFVEAMEREIVFVNAHLLNYKIKQDSPQRPIVFVLTASWIEVS
tara:strand:- start:314 stop:865 length:552 start_codon:yes stop_codon:yes gene_type:complete